MRDYATERQEASGEADSLRARHAEYFLTIAEQATPGLRSAAQSQTAARLELEHDNLRAALHWFVHYGSRRFFGTSGGCTATFKKDANG
jgi:predicted ATPase